MTDNTSPATTTIAITKRLMRIDFIREGPRRVSCTSEEAELLSQNEGIEQMAHPIAVTPTGQLVEGRKALAACRLTGLTEVEVYVVPETPAFKLFLAVCERLAGQLTALQIILECKRGYDAYVEQYPETKRGCWLRQKRSGCAYVPSFTSVTAEALGRSVRWVQEAVSAGQSIAPDVAEVLLESEPRAERKSLLKLAKLPHPRQRQIANKVGSGAATLKIALDPENATASDEGAKYARYLNKLINLLAPLKGFEDHLDHKSVASVRRYFLIKSGEYLPILNSLVRELSAPLTHADAHADKEGEAKMQVAA
jgi:hypothetical protein